MITLPFNLPEKNKLNFNSWFIRHFCQAQDLYNLKFQNFTSENSNLKHAQINSFNAKDLLNESLLMAFTPLGLDITNQASVKKIKEIIDIPTERSKLFLTAFFGLPYRLDKHGYISFDKNEPCTIKNILKYFIGGWEWGKETSTAKKLIQVIGLLLGIKSVLIPAFNLLRIIFSPLVNAIQIFTEFLPNLLVNQTALSIGHIFFAKNAAEHEGRKICKPIYWAGIVALSILHYLAKILSIFGRALTSPLKSLKLAYAYCTELQGLPGKVLGVITASLSGLLSITLWACLLPFVIHLIPTQIIQWVTQSPIGPAIHAVQNVFNIIGKALSPIFSPIIHSISATLSVKVPVFITHIGIGLGSLLLPLIVLLRLAKEKLTKGCQQNSVMVNVGFFRPSTSRSSQEKRNSLSGNLKPETTAEKIEEPEIKSPESSYVSDLDAHVASFVKI